MRLALLLLVACGNRSSDAPSSGSADESRSKPAPTHCSPAGGHLCGGDHVVECGSDSKPGATVQQCKGKCARGACVETCALRDVKLFYTVDSGHYLSSFDPKKLP